MHKVFFDFKKFLSDYDIRTNSKCLVALSGGADSVASLYLSHLLFKEVVAVNINYGLRGEESDQEESYCRDLCKKLGIILYNKKVTDEEKENGSQEKYRDLRYNFFENIYKKTNSDYLVVGHHKNDQAETVFYNLLKGAGIEGLSGIKPLVRNYNMNILRPLLFIKKADILNFLESQNIEYKNDSSNFKDKYTRNKLRLNVIPQLEEEFNVNLVDSLSKLSQNMHDLHDMFNYFYRDIDHKYLQLINDKWIINYKEISSNYHYAIIKNYFYYFLKHKLLFKNISNTYINDIIHLNNSENKSFINLPNNFICQKINDQLIFKKKKTIDSKSSSFKYVLTADEKFVYIPEIDKNIRFKVTDSINDDNSIYLYVNKNDIESIIISSYEEGSKINYSNHQRKKIKQLVKEKSDLALNEVWYVKLVEDVIYIPQIDYRNYKSTIKTSTILQIEIA